jgi:hypothetical protein
MPFTLADAEILLGALATLDRIESNTHRIASEMATFKDTVIAAFTFAKARINQLELENSVLAADDLADAEALAAASAEAAAAKAALEEAIATDTAEDSEILAAAAAFIVPAEEPPVEETPVEEVPVEGQG